MDRALLYPDGSADPLVEGTIEYGTPPVPADGGCPGLVMLISFPRSLRLHASDRVVLIRDGHEDYTVRGMDAEIPAGHQLCLAFEHVHDHDEPV